MVRIIPLAAIILIGAACLMAADEPSRAAKPASAVLQARLDGKKAAVRMAEVDLRMAKVKLARLAPPADPTKPMLVSSSDEIEDAKLAVEKLQAQLDMRKAEEREVAAQLDERKGSVPQYVGPAVVHGGLIGGVPEPIPSSPAVPTAVPAVPRLTPAAAPPQAPKVAVFDMTAVRREFKGFQYRSYLLEKKKREELEPLEKLRKKQAELKKALAAETNADAKKDLVAQIEKLGNIDTEEARIKKLLDKEAAESETACYNEIKLVVGKMAELNGYDIVFAYRGAEPGAPKLEFDPETAEVFDFDKKMKKFEADKAKFQQMRLHPPAVTPFYIARKIETTDVVTRTLNVWYPPKDAKGRPVDVNLLPELP